MLMLLNTPYAFSLSRSLASSSFPSPPTRRLLSISSTFALPPPRFPHSSLVSSRVSPSFRTQASAATATMGDAPDVGMDAVQRRLMFEDECILVDESDNVVGHESKYNSFAPLSLASVVAITDNKD